MRKLRLPSTLAFVVVAAGAVAGGAAIVASCSDDGDGGRNCNVTCIAIDDAGMAIDAGTCPACANANSECPAGCTPIPLG